MTGCGRLRNQMSGPMSAGKVSARMETTSEESTGAGQGYVVKRESMVDAQLLGGLLNCGGLSDVPSGIVEILADA